MAKSMLRESYGVVDMAAVDVTVREREGIQREGMRENGSGNEKNDKLDAKATNDDSEREIPTPIDRGETVGKGVDGEIKSDAEGEAATIKMDNDRLESDCDVRCRNGKVPLASLLEKMKTPLSIGQRNGKGRVWVKREVKKRTEDIRSGKAAETNSVAPIVEATDLGAATAVMPQSVSSGFTSARGSMISISKMAEDAARKLCFEEEEAPKPPISPVTKRKRSSLKLALSKGGKPAYKKPRTKEPRHTLETSVPSETTVSTRTHPNTSKQQPRSVERKCKNNIEARTESRPQDPALEKRSTFSEFRCQENQTDWSKTSLAEIQHAGRRTTLAGTNDMDHVRPRRSRKGWMPLTPSPLQQKAEQPEATEIHESPVMHFSSFAFSASAAISPKLSMTHVFSNGASTLSMYGAMIDAGLTPTLKWIKQQYRWIVWHLSGFVSENEKALTADNTFLELKHRFALEKTQNKTLSILDNANEKTALEHLVLLLADIMSEASQQTKIELSDGRSSLLVEVDEGLDEKIKEGDMKIGMLLFVQRLVMEKVSSGEAVARVSHNSCIPVPGDSPLGKAGDASFFLPISSMHASGGPIATTLVCVFRKYPVLYEHEHGDGSRTYLTKRQHQKKLDDYAQEVKQIRSTAKALVEEEEVKYFKEVIRKRKKGEAVDRMECLYAESVLSNNEAETLSQDDQDQLQTFRTEHAKSFESCLQRQMRQLMSDWGIVQPTHIPRLQLLVSEVTRGLPLQKKCALLNVWLQGRETGGQFHEGDVFEFKNLSVNAAPGVDGWMHLHSVHNTCFRKAFSVKEMLPGYSLHFIPRQPVTDFTSLRDSDLFDFEAFVVSCPSAKTVICVDAQTFSIEASTTLLIITTDAFEMPTSVKEHQLWSFRDLRFVSFSDPLHPTSQITEKTSCTVQHHPTRLNKLKVLYKNNHDILEKRIHALNTL